MSFSLRDILLDLEKTQSAHRYQHTLGVMYTAAALCMKYELDVHIGMLAGALHDCGKLQTIKDYVKECESIGIKINEDCYKAPHLLHADLGAYFAQNKYFIDSPEILHAITVHTTGCPNMSLLDKIIFVADYIEPGRENIPNLETVRRLAFEDINQCVCLILKQTLNYLNENNYYIGKATIKTYEYYAKTSFSQGGSYE